LIEQNEAARGKLRSFSYKATEKFKAAAEGLQAEFTDVRTWEVSGEGLQRHIFQSGKLPFQSSKGESPASTPMDRRLVVNDDYTAEFDSASPLVVQKWDHSGAQNIPLTVRSHLRDDFGPDPADVLFGDGSVSLRDIIKVARGGTWGVTSVTDDDGENVYRVIFARDTQGSPPVFSFDLDPAKDFLVSAYKMYSQEGEMGYERRVDLRQDRSSGVWFPNSYHTRVLRRWAHPKEPQGDSIYATEDFSLSDVIINRPVSPALFRIEALRLTPDMVISNHSIDGRDNIFVWRDGKLIPQEIAAAFDEGIGGIVQLKHVDASIIPQESPASLQPSTIPLAEEVSNGKSLNKWLIGTIVGLTISCLFIGLWKMFRTSLHGDKGNDKA
jgi:hypothetical protein